MFPRRLLLAMVLLAPLAAMPPPAQAWTIVCLGPGDVVCLAYRIVVEVTEDYVRVEITDTKNNQEVLTLCVKPPYVWLGDCTTPPDAGDPRLPVKATLA